MALKDVKKSAFIVFLYWWLLNCDLIRFTIYGQKINSKCRYRNRDVSFRCFCVVYHCPIKGEQFYITSLKNLSY